MKKRIVLSLLPAFVLVGCSDPVDNRHSVPNPESNIVKNDDGSYSKDTVDEKALAGEEQLRQSYLDAKSKGFNGSYEEWVEISELHLKDPEAAQKKAESHGFTGSEMVLAALAGLAIGGLAAKGMNHNDVSFRSHSQQRLNNTANYAAVGRAYKKEDERSSSAGGGYGAHVGGSTAATAAAANSPSRTRSSVSLSKRSNSATLAARSSGASYSTVSRGGFGGAVARGG